MRDAIELEWAGRPAVAIVADALVGAAEQMKRISGMPEYKYIVTPFPVGNLTRNELRQRAKVIVEQAIELLTNRPGANHGHP